MEVRNDGWVVFAETGFTHMRALSAGMLDQNPALLVPVGGTDDSAAVSCLLGGFRCQKSKDFPIIKHRGRGIM